MREIKFRAWDQESKTMVYPNRVGDTFIFGGMYLEELFDDSDVPVMQYTGLKDKNGREIYEGDIVKQDKYIFKKVVEFDDGCFYPFNGWDCGDCSAQASWLREEPDYEVIGNIHENPELLK